MRLSEEPNIEVNAIAMRDRCRKLGLPAWRFDRAGGVLIEPTESGARGLWIRGEFLTKQLSHYVSSLDESTSSVCAQILDGLWVIAIPELNRTRVMGWTVTVALESRMLTSETFEQSCLTARIDLYSTRRALLPLAVHTEQSVRNLCLVFDWMTGDLAEVCEKHEAVAGFTRELSNSYETINMLYGIGRSMTDLTQPLGFLEVVCNRLRDCLSFSWIATVTDEEVEIGSECQMHKILSGTAPEFETDFDEHLKFVLREAREQSGNVDPQRHKSEARLFGSQLVVQPILRGNYVIGVIVAGDKNGDDPHVSSYDTRLLESAAVYAGAFLENARLYREQRQAYLATIEALSAAIDAKDTYTCGHSRRVAFLASQVAAAAGCSQEQIECVRICGLVHDIGKIGIPEAVLCKPGRLTDEEFRIIKQHPEIGHRILKDLPQLRDVLPGVLYHHERFDGKGYPHGLAGENIPLIARILCVADTFDAMSSTRAYRAAMPHEKAQAEIVRCAGTQFDPTLASAFTRVDLQEYYRMVEEDRQQRIDSPSEAPAPAAQPALQPVSQAVQSAKAA